MRYERLPPADWLIIEIIIAIILEVIGYVHSTEYA